MRIRFFVISLLLSSFADAQSLDARQAGNPADVEKQFAALDEDAKALDLIRASLIRLPAVKKLGISDSELAAYLAGVVDLPAVPSHLDAADVVLKLDRVQQDWEVARDLTEIARRNRQLRDNLAGDRRPQSLAKLQANRLLAQARAALTHQETGMTSAPIISEEGRLHARQLVDRVMLLDPGNIDESRVLGDVLLTEGDEQGAEREFRSVVKANPNSAIDHNKLGNALLSQGKAPEAAAEFREALRLDPADFVSHSDLGLALRAQLDPDATAEFREAIRIESRYVDAHNNLGIALATQGKIPEALAEFQEIIRLQPNSALGHFNAATALADLEEDEKSTSELREAVRLNPNHYNAHYNLGEMLRLTGKLDESAKEFREYVNRAPDNPRTQRNKERARGFIKAFEEP